MHLGSNPCPTSAASWEERLICLIFDIKAPKLLQKADVSYWLLPSRSVPLLHPTSFVQQEYSSRIAALPLTRPEKEILLGFSRLNLSCSQTEAFWLCQVSFSPDEDAAAPLWQRDLSPSMLQLTTIFGRIDFQSEHYLMSRSLKFREFLTNILYVSVQQMSG